MRPMRPSAPAMAIRIVFLLLAQWFRGATTGNVGSRSRRARLTGVDERPARIGLGSSFLRLSVLCVGVFCCCVGVGSVRGGTGAAYDGAGLDRKSTRLNSSH